MLYTPKYDVSTRAFCGPTAMSAVTGEPISVIRDAIRQASGRMKTSDGRAFPIMRVSNITLISAMKFLGWDVQEFGIAAIGGNTLRLGVFLDDRGNDGPFIVNVTGHYYAVAHGEICDSFIGLPTDIVRFIRGRRRWVQKWWKWRRVND
jgi:hypothetical protein